MAGDERPGLDYAFLRYIDVQPDVQKRNQRIYLSFFKDCRKVVDLGCGDGDFVELLAESGIEALGVDSDPVACQAARERGISVVCEDVFTYVEGLPAEELDGVFASHLVEHLHYEQVLRLFELTFRALRPGGVVVVTTPNVRALVSHLEMFWLHFGHVAFYHPRLLCFFLEHAGFVEVHSDENEATASPLMPELRASHRGGGTPVGNAGVAWWRRVTRSVRMSLGRLLVGPYIDQLAGRVNALSTALLRMDRPFECYVTARKPNGQ